MVNKGNPALLEELCLSRIQFVREQLLRTDLEASEWDDLKEWAREMGVRIGIEPDLDGVA